MAARRTERLVNLTICLLATRRFLTRDEIRRAVEGYEGLSESNFERTFERDKDDLRALGIPLETGTDDAWFDDALGYRIQRSAFELPPIDWTPQEATAVWLAARIWQEATLESATQSALTKLQAAGADPDAARLGTLAPSVAPGGVAGGPAFDALWNAVQQRRRVSFTYRGGQSRRLEPWLLTFRRGAWYVTGRDVDREEMRQFRLSRILDEPVLIGEAGAYDIPEGIDARAVARRLEPREPDAVATVAIRAEAAPALRRRARTLDVAPPRPGFEVYAIGYAQAHDFAAELAAAGPDVIALDPPELVAQVVTHLHAVVGGTVDGHALRREGER